MTPMFVIPTKAGIQELVSVWNIGFPLPDRVEDKFCGNDKFLRLHKCDGKLKIHQLIICHLERRERS